MEDEEQKDLTEPTEDDALGMAIDAEDPELDDEDEDEDDDEPESMLNEFGEETE